MNSRLAADRTSHTVRLEVTFCCQCRHSGHRGQKTNHEAGLGQLIEAGELQLSELLVWGRPRKKEIHRARIHCARGITPEGTDLCLSLSVAAHFYAKGSYNGWEAWRRARDGVRLDELRARLEVHLPCASRRAHDH
ncbi:hypothetical protein ACFVWN_00380 [Nocardiopsis flavescens]|uniref:restriction system modified-DNA reader domain-containing protein n=1 Tax=Nocardiopsis flavescens TaxID=758803 RepID=UPI00365EABF4